MSFDVSGVCRINKQESNQAELCLISCRDDDADSSGFPFPEETPADAADGGNGCKQNDGNSLQIPSYGRLHRPLCQGFTLCLANLSKSTFNF